MNKRHVEKCHGREQSISLIAQLAQPLYAQFQVVTFGWKTSLGAEVAIARAEQKKMALAEAVKPKEKVVVDEGDLDMFS